MNSFADIIEHWPGGIRGFSDDVGVSYVAAQVMKHRDSIGADHWEAVVSAARERGVSGVSYEVLASLKAAKGRARVRPPQRTASAVA